MAPLPVILQTEVHCHSCARKIRRAVKNLHGVENVWASSDTGLVVVSGWADPWALKWQIESRMRKQVTVVCDGTEDTPRRRWPHGYPSSSFVGHGMPSLPYYPAPHKYNGCWWQ